MDDSKRLIAALRHEPGYILLCDLLGAHVDSMADDMANAETPADVLRLTRVWQVARKFLNCLKTTPESLEETIRLEEARPSMESIPFFGYEEDPFSRRAPVAPPVPRNVRITAPIDDEDF